MATGKEKEREFGGHSFRLPSQVRYKGSVGFITALVSGGTPSNEARVPSKEGSEGATSNHYTSHGHTG